MHTGYWRFIIGALNQTVYSKNPSGPYGYKLKFGFLYIQMNAINNIPLGRKPPGEIIFSTWKITLLFD